MQKVRQEKAADPYHNGKGDDHYDKEHRAIMKQNEQELKDLTVQHDREMAAAKRKKTEAME
jgi:hypothetical protein